MISPLLFVKFASIGSASEHVGLPVDLLLIMYYAISLGQLYDGAQYQAGTFFPLPISLKFFLFIQINS